MSAPKSPLNNNGSIIIRFSHNGFRFSMSKLGEYENTVAYNYALNICNRIAIDINNNSFNCTNNQELILKYNPSAIHNTITRAIIKNIDDTQEVDLRQKCIDQLNNSVKVVEKNILSHLIKYHKPIYTKKDALDFSIWLKKERNLSGVSIARYFDTLRTIDEIFREIKIEKNVKPLPKPFSKQEVKTILEWFKTHKIEYYNYVYFLFLTGCRTSEAIGLRWKHIDFENNIIFFYETLARDNNNSANRVKKTTKKNILRKFPINKSLLNLLTTLKQGEKEDLVFTFNGHCIDDKNFRNRYWVKCLKECEIDYRKPYNTRHTFITHFLEQTKDVVKCASLTHASKSGVRTIWEHYAGILNKVEVPDLF